MSSAKETFFGGSVGEVKNFCIKPFRHNLFRNNYFRPNPQLLYLAQSRSHRIFSARPRQHSILVSAAATVGATIPLDGRP